ncbi:MAG TPA: acetate--CoA ligase family protein [Jatrophihabitans sp.]
MTATDLQLTAELPRDQSGRALALREIGWQRLFEPKVIAVVGASETEGTQQRAQWQQVYERLTKRGAAVHPIHPSKDAILGVPAYRSVLDVPGDVDVAVLLVREPLPVLEECVQKGVGFAVVFAAGFDELGDTPAAQEAIQRMHELSARNVRVIGPNTNLNFFEPWRTDLVGKPLVIITQSGYQGRPISQGQELGIPIRRWATLGNEVDIEFADFLHYFATNGETGCIAAFVEGFKDGRTLQLAADTAARRGVPIVCVKVGRSDYGRSMAQAHTGHLTGPDGVHDAVFDQYGVIRIDDMDELIEISGLFCHAPRPSTDGGVAIYALSGGTASHVADLCGVAGVPIHRLTDHTIEELGTILPSFLRRTNPVDTGGTFASRPEGRRILELMVEDPNTSILFVPITGVFPGMSDGLARDIVDMYRKGCAKPIVVAWTSPIRDESHRALCEAGVPLFHSFVGAVRGMRELLNHTRFVAEYESPFAGVAVAHTSTEAAAIDSLVPARGTTLNEYDAKRLLAAYGVPIALEATATSVEEAVGIASSFGGPVVLKVLSADVAHKSDLGLVEFPLRDSAEVEDSARRLLAKAATLTGVRIDGLLVQECVQDAVAEILLGVTHQHPFGPVITVGFGGVLTEIYEDVSFLVPPFTRKTAQRAVEKLKAYRLLTGFRGKPPADIDALLDAVMALQRCVVGIGDHICELDINPVLLRPAGLGAVAVDALIIGRQINSAE